MTSSFDETRLTVVSENLKVIREGIAAAAVKSGRSPSDVRLMAVTKTVAPELINYAITHCGVDLIGENKVQEFLGKKDSLCLVGVEKHLIGHLQTNKVKKIISEVDMIQSVDSFKLATVISGEAAKAGVVAKVLLEINIGSENSKTGFDKSAFFESLSAISELPNIEIKGLMTIPPICENEAELDGYFYNMQSYFEELKALNYENFSMDILSMGMSGDYIQAILHGSNLVRVGSAIFGPRIYK